jgi:hypothetical protein
LLSGHPSHRDEVLVGHPAGNCAKLLRPRKKNMKTKANFMKKLRFCQ